MSTLTLQIENMHCGACVRRVSDALNSLPNTHAEEVSIGAARIVTDATPAQVQQALIAAGYPAVFNPEIL
jgi:copper chaperone CopZ